MPQKSKTKITIEVPPDADFCVAVATSVYPTRGNFYEYVNAGETKVISIHGGSRITGIECVPLTDDRKVCEAAQTTKTPT